MAVRRYRNGKVALLSAFPFWKLDFGVKSFNESDSTYAKLVENMVLWLVARDDLERIAITPEKPIFIAGETVRLNARVLDESYIPVADATVEARAGSTSRDNDTLTILFQPQKTRRFHCGVAISATRKLPDRWYGEPRREDHRQTDRQLHC